MRNGHLAIGVCLMLLEGCGGEVHQACETPERTENGLVIVLTGIEGRSTFNQDICDGLFDGNVPYAIEIYDWTSSMGPLWNLRTSNRNHHKAQEIADYIARYHEANPNCPVYLVGQSGGGAIAIWTAEALAPSERLDGIVLLAASISPDYDLERALSNSRQGIVSFYSCRDYMLWGTNITGTMDGEHTSSAGRTGFQVPPGLSGLYGKLYEIPWQSGMSGSGNIGLHVTSGAAGFVAQYVAPFILSPVWNRDVVTRVQKCPDNKKGSRPLGPDPSAPPRSSPMPQTRPALSVEAAHPQWATTTVPATQPQSAPPGPPPPAPPQPSTPAPRTQESD